MSSLPAVILIAAALFLFWLSAKFMQSSGLPKGKIIYSDSHKYDQTVHILLDRSIGLAGKPDYIVVKGKERIPVELKSVPTKSGPYESHIYQLMAYCRLVHVNHRFRPSYGLLQYPNRSFKIEYTSEMEARLLELVRDIQACSSEFDQQRSHQSRARCRGCSYADICDQKLM